MWRTDASLLADIRKGVSRLLGIGIVCKEKEAKEECEKACQTIEFHKRKKNFAADTDDAASHFYSASSAPLREL